MSQKTCCVPGCSVTAGSGIQLHCFPNPRVSADLFKMWVTKIGGDIKDLDDDFTYSNRRVCRRHFDNVFIYPTKLCALAVPSLHLPGVRETFMEEPPITSDDMAAPSTSELAQTLKSHTMAKHPDKYYKQMYIDAGIKEVKKTAFVPPTSRVSKRLQQKKSTDSKEIEAESKAPDSGAKEKRKTMFECPKCLQMFSVYFSACKHIQKRHCEDKDGNPVSPDSEDLIKPISKEVNSSGVEQIKKASAGVTESHKDESYCCLACKQSFHDVTLFDEHVQVFHKNNINIFILESMNEFLNWKRNIEAKQRVKYLTLSNATQKQYYQCNYVSPQNSANVTHLCPSMMIVREFSKSVQVRYHEKHYGHTCEPLQLTNDKTDVILDHNETYDNLLKSGEDVFTKFKDLLKSVEDRAAVIKRTQLKPLYILALEMQAYLNSLKGSSQKTPSIVNDFTIKAAGRTITIDGTIKTSNESIDSGDDDNRDDVNDDDVNRDADDGNRDDEDVDESISKSMTDDQITKALEPSRVSARLKRKSESSPARETKKKKLDPAPSEKAGLKENNSQSKDLICSERFESPRPNVSSPFSASPSFNDSYKQFIEGTSPKVKKKESIGAKKVKKEVVKTKMGQFSPKKAPVNYNSENVDSNKKEAEKTKTRQISLQKAVPGKVATENSDNKKKKKGPAKSNTSLEHLNIEDVEYEVVEQENDCNILILKI